MLIGMLAGITAAAKVSKAAQLGHLLRTGEEIAVFGAVTAASAAVIASAVKPQK